MVDRDELVRQRAFAIWLSEGCPHGRDEAHWLMASAEIDAEATAKPAKAKAKAAKSGTRAKAPKKRALATA